jgi:hypothetical protein
VPCPEARSATFEHCRQLEKEESAALADEEEEKKFLAGIAVSFS